MGTCPKHGRFAEDELWCPLCPDPPAVCHECAGPVEGKTSYPGDCEIYTCERCREEAEKPLPAPHPAPTCRCPACARRRALLNLKYAAPFPPQGRSVDGKPRGDRP